MLHLLYARFFTKVIRDLGLTTVDEPFINLLTQGMVCKETYRCAVHGWLLPGELAGPDQGAWLCATCRASGTRTVVEKGRTEKMSKSKKNVVDPEYLISTFGADTARMFSLFAAPPEKDLEWSDSGVEGASRFLHRVWRLIMDVAPKLAATGVTAEGSRPADLPAHVKDLKRLTHRTIKKVTEDIEREFQFNTAIAALMEFVNGLYKFVPDYKAESASPVETAALRESVRALVQLLGPFAPHIAEELWEVLGERPTVSDQPWPQYDPEHVASERLTIPIQVNGKLRSRIEVPADATEEDIVARAKEDAKLAEWLQGKTTRKVIYVKHKLVNFVV